MARSDNIGLAFGLTAGAGLATTLGALIVFLVPSINKPFLAISMAFSAGVMVFVSFTEMLGESHVFFKDEGMSQAEATGYSYLGLFVGIIIGYCLDWLVHKIYPHSHGIETNAEIEDEKIKKMEAISKREETEMQPITADPMRSAKDSDQKSGHKDVGPSEVDLEVAETGEGEEKESEVRKLNITSLRAGISIFLHNFPEGVATFAAVLADPAFGAALAVAIAIHNIPEGVSVAVPIYYASRDKCKAFWFSFLSGISEPIGGAIALAIVGADVDETSLAVLLSIVAGIMVFVSFTDLYPTAQRYDPEDKYTAKSLFLGMFVMALSLFLFDL
mmetsp:Transcript_34842/g.39492  ORF Transcript_34842/g.39492 Transcript_34842/m.39492 type:complete len:331 (-) Transcript_34842:393-1385(-)